LRWALAGFVGLVGCAFDPAISISRFSGPFERCLILQLKPIPMFNSDGGICFKIRYVARTNQGAERCLDRLGVAHGVGQSLSSAVFSLLFLVHHGDGSQLCLRVALPEMEKEW